MYSHTLQSSWVCLIKYDYTSAGPGISDIIRSSSNICCANNASGGSAAMVCVWDHWGERAAQFPEAD